MSAMIFTVLLIILFGIFDEDSYTVSVSVGQEDEADIIAGYLLSFGIAVTVPVLWPIVTSLPSNGATSRSCPVWHSVMV